MVIRLLIFFNSLLEGLSKLCVGLAFLILIVAVVVQVVGRSALFDAPVWTEELSRFALLYLAAFGVGLSFLRGDLVNVDIVCEALPGRLPWLLRLLSAVIVAVLSLALLPSAWIYTGIGVFQTSPALGWPMHYIHASTLCLLGSLFLFALVRILSMVSGISSGLPENQLPQETVK